MEFRWPKPTSPDALISLSIPFTTHFHSSTQTTDPSNKRTRIRHSKSVLVEKMLADRDPFDGSLSLSPTSLDALPSATLLRHLPTLASVVCSRQRSDDLIGPNFSFTREKNHRSTFQWNLNPFDATHAPLLLLAYQNRKWKSWNHLATIHPTSNKDLFQIEFVRQRGFVSLSLQRLVLQRNLPDRLLFIRCWPESNSETKFDRLAEHLCTMCSMKSFSCLLARQRSSFDPFAHYALTIVPTDKTTLGEEMLRQGNYTELIAEEQVIEHNPSHTLINPSQSQQNFPLQQSSTSRRNKYAQLFVQEGTMVRDTDRDIDEEWHGG